MTKQHSPRFLALVEDAKQRVLQVTAAELKRKLEHEDHFHLIDVREEHEWNAGHVPRAQHLCKGILERDMETAVPDLNAEIILYCGGGYRSALAGDNLQKMGYTRVRSLAGGWRGWLEGGYLVE